MAPGIFRRLKDLRRDRGLKDSDDLKKKQDGDLKDGTVNSSGQMQSGHCEDGLRTPIAGRNPPEDGGSDAAQSLWDRAYGALKTENPRLVKKYEKLLSRELPKTSSNPNTSKGDPPDQAEESLDETDNCIDNWIDKVNLQKRRAQLDTIIKDGLQRMDEKKTKYHIANHEFVLQDQIAQAAVLVQKVKDFVGEAVQVSPEASLAWAGVCIILPLLTNPSIAEQANRDGFTYVTARMRYYVALEPLLLLRNQDHTVTVPKNLIEEFEAYIVDLYQHILDFQFRSVLRFYRSWRGNLSRDLIQHDDWKGMLARVQELEKIVDTDSTKINTSVSRQALEKLSEMANGSLEIIKTLLAVAERQLQVSEESRDILSEIAKFTEDTNKILTESHDPDQAAIDLPTVENAPYDSEADQDIPLCQEGTRVSILNHITTWANDITSETIFWVYGPAGTGKSTITRSLARFLACTGQLGASYFFKRGEEDRNGTAKFLPTIASQLVTTIPMFKTYLRKSLEKLGSAKIEKKALEEQFKTLILTPLSMLPDKSGILTRVIVIDALDECEQENHIPRLLSLLLQVQELRAVRLRVFLTSRSANPIVDAFEDLRNNGATYRSLALHKEFYDETKADISAFLKAQFSTIKAKRKITKDPWPDLKDLVRLVTLASQPSPLFIYAATLCRFIGDETGRKRPAKQLELWLKECDSNASQLNQIYVPILSQVLLGTEKEGEKGDALGSEDRLQLLQILGSIILLATPLPARGLAALLNIDEDDVNHWLRNLHAVLDVPSDPSAPVRLLHKSFNDFLLGNEGTGTDNFRVNAAETHAMLASKCIQRMASDNGLRKDICNIGEPGKLKDEIGKAVVACHIPPDLDYACLYWVHHLQHSGSIKDEKAIYNFLQEHFLHWLESLSLLGKLSNGILSIRELLKTIQSSPDTSIYFTSLLKDAEKFALSYGSIIERVPLQTYGAALVFCPTRSEVKQRFWEQRLPFIANVKGIRRGWDSFLQALEGHNGSVWAVAFSPDGKVLASGSSDQTVQLWDAATGAHKQTLEGHSDSVRTVAFSPDGQTLVSASDDKTVRLWDAATGAYKQTLKGHSRSVRAVAFSPDSKTLASGSWDKTIQLWDAATGAHKQTFKGHTHSVRAVAFSPDGRTLASGSDDKIVRLWDATTGAYKQILNGHSDSVWAVTFSPDSKMLASGSWDKTVRLWDAATGMYKQTLEGHSDSVRAVAFSPDSQTLASGSDDNTLRLWDTATGAYKRTLEGHSRSVLAVAFSPDGQTLASGSNDDIIRFWDTATNADKQTLKGHSDSVSMVAFSPDGKILASCSLDKTVQLWDAATGMHKQTLEGHSRCVRAVAFSPDGQILVSGSDDNTIRLWDTATGTYRQTLEGHSRSVKAVAFSPDGKILASGSDDDIVRLWDAATGICRQTLEGHGRFVEMPNGHSDSVLAVAFSPDGKILVSGSWDKTVRLWDASTGVYKQTLEGHSRCIRTVAFSPDSQTLASGSDDNTIRLWDAATGMYKQSFENHSRSVKAVAFSPDGQMLASGSDDDIVRLWDAATGTHRQTLEGHSGFVYAVAFSPDSKILASASGDQTIRLWDTATGAHRHTLEGHSDSVNAVAFSPDSKTLASASYDQTVRLWDMATAVTFSPDGQTLASGSDDDIVRLWDAVTGMHRQTLKGHGRSTEALNGHNRSVRAVAFSPDGKTLASGSDDKTVRLWDAATGAHKQTLEGHSHSAWAVAFSPDGKTLASGSWDKAVRLWDVVTGTYKRTLNIEQCLQRPPFSEDSQYLQTDLGLLSLTPHSISSDSVSTCLDKEGSTCGAVFVCEDWITRDGQSVIWLPQDYRAICSAFYGNVLVLGHASG